MNADHTGRGHWAAQAWARRYAGPVQEVPGMLDGDPDEAALWVQGMASFEEDPEADVLLGLSGLLDASAGQDADWHDLEGADEPDWDMAVYDSLESFEGFEGFDDYAPAHVDEADEHPAGMGHRERCRSTNGRDLLRFTRHLILFPMSAGGAPF